MIVTADSHNLQSKGSYKNYEKLSTLIIKLIRYFIIQISFTKKRFFVINWILIYVKT